ncbi:MAG: ASCH domain-containing protein [Acidobacteria bacterium]|nr:ASCH domain-containing protein [Acidobacteriota bacterium]
MCPLTKHPTSFNAPHLRVAAEYIPAIRAGRKTTTIRKGRRTFDHEVILLKSGNASETVKITEVKHTAFKCLTEEDARKDGFASLEELKLALLKHYSDLQDDDWVTIFSFELLSNALS